MRCVVLDDYQGVALANADWSGLDVTVLREHLDDPAPALAEAECVVIMRERTPFDAALFARLPRLRLLSPAARATRRSTWTRPARTA